MSATTLRYHVYCEPSQGHNQRTPEVIAAENAGSAGRWIDPAAHEVWGPGQTEGEAYGTLFGEAIKEYNDRQKRKDRRLTVEGYMESVRADTRGRTNKAIAAANKRAEERGRPQDVRKAKGKHCSYEVVMSLGNVAPQRDPQTKRVLLDSSGRRVMPNKLPEDVCRQVYRAYADSWQQRNPNFYLYRADYHNGEWFRVKSGGEDLTGRGGPSGQWAMGVPHPHFSFIPYAEGYKKGLSRQVSVGKALAAMGFKDYQETGPDGEARTVTAWEQWQQREQEYIAGLVAQYLPGYVIQAEGQRETALSTQEYQEVQDMKDDAQQIRAEASGYFAEVSKLVSTVQDEVQGARAEAQADRQAAAATRAKAKATAEGIVGKARTDAQAITAAAEKARQEAQEAQERALTAQRVQVQAELDKARQEVQEAAEGVQADKEAQERARAAWEAWHTQQRSAYERWESTKRRLLVAREEAAQRKEADLDRREASLDRREAGITEKEAAMDTLQRQRYERQLAAQQRQREERTRQRVQDAERAADGLQGPDGPTGPRPGRGG